LSSIEIGFRKSSFVFGEDIEDCGWSTFLPSSGDDGDDGDETSGCGDAGNMGEMQGGCDAATDGPRPTLGLDGDGVFFLETENAETNAAGQENDGNDGIVVTGTRTDGIAMMGDDAASFDEIGVIVAGQ
jgi:hypothetical protein